jgi:hypothetical protein
MSDFESLPAHSSAYLLRGVICNYRKTRNTRDFMFTAADKAKLEAAALIAGTGGLGGLAV